jgi:hypothetical protein
VSSSGNDNVTIVKGEGDYGGLLSLLGPVGGLANMLLGGKPSTGCGDYKVSENSLVLGGNVPMIKNIDKGAGVLIQNKEYITDILSSEFGTGNTLFQNQSFNIQPGDSNTFPWLSQIAPNFQEYKVRGMIFEYKSLSAEAVVGSNNSGALGEVIMSTNYNVTQPNFVSKQQMLQAEFSNDDKPSRTILHPIECEPTQSPLSELYVRTGPVPSGQDQRFYDLGNFQIATQGCQSTDALLGELWVTYEVEFYKPILSGAIQGTAILTDHYGLDSISGTAPLGTGAEIAQIGNSIGGIINWPIGTTYTFPSSVTSGNFLFVYYDQGFSTGWNDMTITASTGTTFKQLWSNTSGGADQVSRVIAPQTGLDAVTKVITAFIIGVSPTASVLPVVVTFASVSGSPPVSGSGDLWVTQINSSITN